SPSNRRRPQILHLPLDLSIISWPRLSHYLTGDLKFPATIAAAIKLHPPVKSA
ncbi:unnamed protein product, partial [Urochloa humidicola]